MKPQWTDDQQKAIDAEGKGIVVSAAAGSGKTAVLIERTIRRLTEKDGVPADKLLAVTFTNDAAAQMRDKLNSAFEKEIAKDPDNSWLLKQQNLLQLARISTIDSFCLDLVKENLHKSEYQGGIRIIDNTADLIFQQAFEKASEDLLEENPKEYDKLFSAFSPKNKTDTFKEICRGLYDFLRSQPFPDKWIKKAYGIYTDDESFECFLDSLYEKLELLVNKLEKQRDILKTCSDYVIELAGEQYRFTDYYPGILDDEKGHIPFVNQMINDISDLVDKKDFEGIRNFNLKDYKKPKKNKIKGDKFPQDVSAVFESEKDIFNTAYDKIFAIMEEIKSVFPVPLEIFRENMKTAGELFGVLCNFVKRIENNAGEIKLEKNSVDFGDIEIMAKNLLLEETDDGYRRTELAENIRKSNMYQIIMIDEFQDVNDLQEVIFKAISDSDDPQIMGRNVFVVGDMKQSIYRFRQSNPKLFRKALELAQNKDYSDKLQAIYLKMNFRSRKNIIDSVNFIFKQLMSEKCGDVRYCGNEMLEKGAKYSTKNEETEIMLIDMPEKKDDKAYSPEYIAVAKKIRKMIDEGETVYKDGEDIPCRPSDFCVLLQNNDEKKKVSDALETVGINSRTVDEEGYIKSREISIMLDILRTVDNPMNDISLTAVMMSPVFAFTPDEMIKVRNLCIDNKTGYCNHIYQVLTATDSSKKNADEKEADYIDVGDENLQVRCQNVYRLFDTLRYYSMSMNLERLIRKIFDMTDLMGLTALYRDSEKKRANLRLLLEYASDYEKNSNEGISGFLRYIDSVSENNKAFSQAMTIKEPENSVNVMTYHASKGLEFPFVFICNTGKQIISGNHKKAIYCDSEKGVAFNFYDKDKKVKKYNPYFDFMKNLSDSEEKSEKMRLLYVGLTRAKEKLFITVANKESEKKSARGMISSSKQSGDISQTVAEQNSMKSWIQLALAEYPGNEDFLRWEGFEEEEIEKMSGMSVSDGARFVFERISQDEEDFSCEKNEERSSSDKKIVKELTEKFSFHYDDSLTKAPSKLTVTEIVKAEKEKTAGEKNPEFYPNLPRLDEEIDKLSSAEKGTFTHRFMELADYSLAEKSVENELDRLVKEGFFTKKEATGVYVDSLRDFFAGDFYKRMKNSDDVRREQQFLVSVGDMNLPENLKNITGDEGMIQGIADCIFKENGEWVLVDYKTDNFSSKEDMTRYGTQLALYKSAFELILDERIKSCYIYSFKLRQGMEFDL